MSKVQVTPPTDALPDDPKQIPARDSLNLVEFPLAVLADRVPAGLTALEFQDVIRDPQTGEEVTRRLVVDASERFGLPTALDDEVILGLIQITKLRNNFADRKVYFSRYELLRLLGWANSGQNYRRIEESLDRWMRVTLDYRRAWWDHQRKSWVDVKFHVIDQVHLYDSEVRRSRLAAQTPLPFSWFEWNEVVFRSFADGYLKRLNLDLYLRLRLPVARRMYRFLDKRFYHRPRVEFDLATFAFEHVGLSRGYHTGKIKEKLAPAIAELEAAGFLEPLAPADRYAMVRRGEWRVVFVRRPAATTPDPAAGLERELVRRGVTAKTAARLVAAHPGERIAQKVDVFDWLREEAADRLGTNPAGYLVQSIRDDYAPPAGYEPRAERERGQQVKAAAAAERQQAAAERRQQERAEWAERAAAQARRAHIERYLATLTVAERAALEERAIAAGEEWQQRCVRSEQPGAALLRRLLVEQEVLRACPLGGGP